MSYWDNFKNKNYLDRLALFAGTCSIAIEDYNTIKDNPAGAIAPIACGLTRLISGLRYLSIALGLMFIIIGGIQYSTSAGDPEKANKGRSSITWAIVAIILALTFWFLMIFLAKSFGLEIIDGDTITLPDNIDLTTETE